MKIEITVELEDAWVDDEGNLNQEVEKIIKREVVREIYEKVQNSVNEQITKKVYEEVEANYKIKINEFISEFFKTGKVKYGYDKELITLESYIKRTFENNQGWNSPSEQIEKLAQKHGEELKKRYDLLFASQLVSKMHETGLLKDDVARLLLDIGNDGKGL